MNHGYGWMGGIYRYGCKVLLGAGLLILVACGSSPDPSGGGPSGGPDGVPVIAAGQEYLIDAESSDGALVADILFSGGPLTGSEIVSGNEDGAFRLQSSVSSFHRLRYVNPPGAVAGIRHLGVRFANEKGVSDLETLRVIVTSSGDRPEIVAGQVFSIAEMPPDSAADQDALRIFVAYGDGVSGGTDTGLRTEFSIYAFPLHEAPAIEVTGLPDGASFVDYGDGSGRFVWPIPTAGNYTLMITSTSSSGSFSTNYTLKVGDYGYPEENAGPMIMPDFPPPEGSAVFHASSGGNDANPATAQEPVTLDRAIDLAREAVHAASGPVYILLKRGDVWPGAYNSFIRSDLRGYPDRPIVFGAYGEGDLPYFESFVSSANIEYLHFQDIRVSKMLIRGNLYSSDPSETYPGTDIPVLVPLERFVIQRIRFYRCVVDGGGMSFFNIYTNAGRGSRVPESNEWFGGGKLAGVVRDIEISHCRFENVSQGGTPDAINFTAVDRGVWIHDNLFLNSREEHIDISGGYGHVIENNIAVGSTTNNGIKLHSQYNLLRDSIIRNNTILYAGGWNTMPVGGSGNAFVAANTAGILISGNNFISRWSVAYGDDNRIDDRAYYGTFAGNIIENNVYSGGVQMVGFLQNSANQVANRNRFRNNLYRAWSGSSKLMRFWGEAGVRLNVNYEHFREWTRRPVSNERYFTDLQEVFVDPFDPEDPNSPLNLDDYGDWNRWVDLDGVGVEGAVVGAVQADGKGSQIVTWSIDGAPAFAIDKSGVITTRELLDHERQSRYRPRVRAISLAGASEPEEVTIDVLDVAE